MLCLGIQYWRFLKENSSMTLPLAYGAIGLVNLIVSLGLVTSNSAKLEGMCGVAWRKIFVKVVLINWIELAKEESFSNCVVQELFS